MTKPIVRRLVRKRTAVISGGRTLHTWNDLLYTFPGLVGVKTGHTSDAGWSEVAAARRDGTTLYAVILGSPGRARRNKDLAALLEWGFDQYGRVTLVAQGTALRDRGDPFLRRARRPRRGRGRGNDRPPRRRHALRRDGRLRRRWSTCPSMRGQKLGEVVITDGDRVRRAPSARGHALGTGAEPRATRLGWYTDRALDEAESMLGSIFG